MALTIEEAKARMLAGQKLDDKAEGTYQFHETISLEDFKEMHGDVQVRVRTDEQGVTHHSFISSDGEHGRASKGITQDEVDNGLRMQVSLCTDRRDETGEPFYLLHKASAIEGAKAKLTFDIMFSV